MLLEFLKFSWICSDFWKKFQKTKRDIQTVKETKKILKSDIPLISHSKLHVNKYCYSSLFDNKFQMTLHNHKVVIFLKHPKSRP